MVKTAHKKAATGTGGPHPPLFYRLNSLLHTVHIIAEHEEQLCVLMTEIKTTGAVTAAHHAELQHLLEEIPSSEYQSDLDAIRDVVTQPNTPAPQPEKSVRKSATKAAKKSPAKRVGSPSHRSHAR